MKTLMKHTSGGNERTLIKKEDGTYLVKVENYNPANNSWVHYELKYGLFGEAFNAVNFKGNC